MITTQHSHQHHQQRLSESKGSRVNNNNSLTRASPRQGHLDLNLARSPRLLLYIREPRTARGQHRYYDLLLRGSSNFTGRPASAPIYSIDIVEGWMPWKVIVAGSAPLLGSVAATMVWYFVGYGGPLLAFQVGILVALLGWGVVALLVLVSW